MNTPVYDAIKHYAEANPVRMHMPSHGGLCTNGLYASATYDITELSLSDNMLMPQGIIAESERLCAARYGAKYAVYGTNGATVIINAVIGALSDNGRGALVIGPAHRSVYTALTTHSMPYISADVFNPADLTDDISVVIITSPDYYGVCADLEYISTCARKRGKLIFVDSSHGAHFPYCSSLPQCAAAYSDISVYSPHKTMPVYTGGSLAVTDNERLYDLTCYYRTLYHSTSPSYLTLSSLDYAGALYEERGEEMINNIILIAKRELSRLPARYGVMKNDDPTRIVIECKGVSAAAVMREAEKSGVYAEAAFGDKLIMILTPYNAHRLSEVIDALCGINVDIPAAQAPIAPSAAVKPTVTCDGIDFVDIDKAIGRISADNLSAYPPTEYIAVRGSVIDEKTAEIIKNRDVFPLINGKIAVFRS